MRILFITNFYPPLGQGGYEEWCAEAADRLRQRGHEVVVLTSRHLRDTVESTESAWIRRELHLEMPLVSLRNSLLFFTRHARERENLAIVDDAITRWQPDVALIWGMWNLSRSLPARIESRMGSLVAYYFGDYWPTPVLTLRRLLECARAASTNGNTQAYAGIHSSPPTHL